jgi:hypothetical protein
MHFVIDYLSGGGDKIYREDFRDLKFDNLPDVLNFFNEKYEKVAKVFNEMLLEKLKEELEEEKKKQEEQEQQEQEKSEQGEGQDGEGQDGEGKEGEGEGKPQKMSAKDIEKLLEELSKDQKGQSKQGQNDNSGDEIDLEDLVGGSISTVVAPSKGTFVDEEIPSETASVEAPLPLPPIAAQSTIVGMKRSQSMISVTEEPVQSGMIAYLCGIVNIQKKFYPSLP